MHLLYKRHLSEHSIPKKFTGTQGLSRVSSLCFFSLFFLLAQAHDGMPQGSGARFIVQRLCCKDIPIIHYIAYHNPGLARQISSGWPLDHGPWPRSRATSLSYIRWHCLREQLCLPESSCAATHQYHSRHFDAHNTFLLVPLGSM